MDIKIKKLVPDAVIPSYAKEGDAGMDLTVTSVKTDERGLRVYGFGISLEIPKGYVGLVFPRSSVSKKELILSNCVGVIDSGYRGEIMAKFRPTLSSVSSNIFRKILSRLGLANTIRVDRYLFPDVEYVIGERAAQIIILPYPSITFVESDELSSSERGEGGYGSSGN